MTDGEKIKTIRKALGLTQESFGEPLGISKGHISDVEKDKKNLSKSAIELLKVRYAVLEKWWETGEGAMFAPSEQPLHVADNFCGYSPEVKVAADYLEVKVRGKTPEERLKFIEEIMSQIINRAE